MKRHASGLKALLWIWGILAVLYLACGVWIAWAVYTERPLASVLDPAILPVLTAGCMVVAALALSIGVLYLRGRVLIPLKRLHELVEYWPDSSPELLRKEAEGILGAPGDTAKILIQRIEQMEEKLKKLRAGEEAAAANRDVLSQYETLLRSAVPCHLLPELSPEGSAILAGIAEPEGVAAGILYDRFSVGTDRVCVIIGEASGVGADAVFHAGLAHGILRCLLTAGRPLNETMTVMNTWLMEREDRFTLRVMAGALNLRDGRFDFVNAGGRLPLLRRKGEQYEWMEPYACSVLGVNRNAAWDSRTILFRGGDRLFLYTDGLGDVRDRSGVRFSEKELRAALNRSREKAKGVADTLRFVANEAAAYCESEADRIPYAALMLEYAGESREGSCCELPASPASAGKLMEFMKRQFEPLGIPRRVFAGPAVLADELFALCCRYCSPDSEIRTECAVDPEQNRVELRMAAALSGKNPLEEKGNMSAKTAAEFIRGQAREIRFELGAGRDTVTLVCGLDRD